MGPGGELDVVKTEKHKQNLWLTSRPDPDNIEYFYLTDIIEIQL